MQIFELNQLSYHQQEKLRPVIEKQKQKEKSYTKNRNWFIVLFWGLCISWLPFGLISFIKEYIQTGYDNQMILPIVIIFGFIIVFYGLWFMMLSELKPSNKEKEKDDFFIVYGYIENKKKRYYSTSDSTDTLYYYVVDGEEVQVSTAFFKGFKYNKIPVGEHRYLLLRVQDGLIRKDITEYLLY